MCSFTCHIFSVCMNYAQLNVRKTLWKYCLFPSTQNVAAKNFIARYARFKMVSHFHLSKTNRKKIGERRFSKCNYYFLFVWNVLCLCLFYYNSFYARRIKRKECWHKNANRQTEFVVSCECGAAHTHTGAENKTIKNQLRLLRVFFESSWDCLLYVSKASTERQAHKGSVPEIY